MTLSRAYSVAFCGLEAKPVAVEVDTCKSNSEKQQTFSITGLPDAAVKESKDRVTPAIRNSNYKLPNTKVFVNLAPGELKKEGTLYDLPIAIALLSSTKLIKTPHLKDYLIVGELSLSGELRPVKGALSIAVLAKKFKRKGVILPIFNAKEAAHVPGIDIIGIRTLNQAAKFLSNEEKISPTVLDIKYSIFNSIEADTDFSDIKGQEHAKRALEIAAAGGHNVLLCGPPGCGKTMMAKAMVGIMPHFTLEESLETSSIYSISGNLPPEESILKRRPFRSPHHTISYAGLVGGGRTPSPGEVSLAHNGVLFLDEFPEFSKRVLEVLRQPLEDRKVTVSRASGTLTFPTNFICIAAMNPCPCGYLGHPERSCKDTEIQVERYQGKISGPLMDRIDMHIEVPALTNKELFKNSEAESSEAVRKRVNNARKIQSERFSSSRTNATLKSSELKSYCQVSNNVRALLKNAIESMSLSSRAYDRILRVARTIADLNASPSILEEHIMESLSYKKVETTSSREAFSSSY